MLSIASEARLGITGEKRIAKTLAGRSILLVEDVPIDQRLLATLLQRAGASVTLECNGQAAVEGIFPRFGQPRSYDAVVMDLVMSPIDGAEATAQLRERGFHAPILITTASDDPADEIRCRDAGCSEFLRKPVDHELLIGAVASCIGEHASIKLAHTSSDSHVTHGVHSSTANSGR